MEIMWIHNGVGSSTMMLTGANVIDIAPSKYSIYDRRKVSDAIQEYAMSKKKKGMSIEDFISSSSEA
jgi:hypothetical protein